MVKRMNTLIIPNKLSYLAEMAGEDMMKCKDDPKFEFEPGIWIVKASYCCAGCLFGTILYQRTDCDNLPVDRGIEVAACAVDNIRRGQLRFAVKIFYGKEFDTPFFNMPPFTKATAKDFKLGLKKQIDWLRERGL